MIKCSDRCVLRGGDNIHWQHFTCSAANFFSSSFLFFNSNSGSEILSKCCFIKVNTCRIWVFCPQQHTVHHTRTEQTLSCLEISGVPVKVFHLGLGHVWPKVIWNRANDLMALWMHFRNMKKKMTEANLHMKSSKLQIWRLVKQSTEGQW